MALEFSETGLVSSCRAKTTEYNVVLSQLSQIDDVVSISQHSLIQVCCEVRCMTFSPTHLLVCLEDATVQLYDLETAALVEVKLLPVPALACVCLSDGSLPNYTAPSLVDSLSSAITGFLLLDEFFTLHCFFTATWRAKPTWSLDTISSSFPLSSSLNTCLLQTTPAGTITLVCTQMGGEAGRLSRLGSLGTTESCAATIRTIQLQLYLTESNSVAVDVTRLHRGEYVIGGVESEIVRAPIPFTKSFEPYCLLHCRAIAGDTVTVYELAQEAVDVAEAKFVESVDSVHVLSSSLLLLARDADTMLYTLPELQLTQALRLTASPVCCCVSVNSLYLIYSSTEQELYVAPLNRNPTVDELISHADTYNEDIFIMLRSKLGASALLSRLETLPFTSLTRRLMARLTYFAEKSGVWLVVEAFISILTAGLIPQGTELFVALRDAITTAESYETVLTVIKVWSHKDKSGKLKESSLREAKLCEQVVANLIPETLVTFERLVDAESLLSEMQARSLLTALLTAVKLNLIYESPHFNRICKILWNMALRSHPKTHTLDLMRNLLLLLAYTPSANSSLVDVVTFLPSLSTKDASRVCGSCGARGRMKDLARLGVVNPITAFLVIGATPRCVLCDGFWSCRETAVR